MKVAPLSVTLRPVRRVDCGLLARLHERAFDEPWEAAALARLLSAPNVSAWIAEAPKLGGLLKRPRACGFVMVRSGADECEILTLAVAPGAARNGVGRKLVTTALAAAYVAGARTAYLEVRVSNTPARALYDKLGFTQVGRRKDYYADGEDALVLSRPLGASDGEGAGPLGA